MLFGAAMSMRDVAENFFRRGLESKVKSSEAVEAGFGEPQDENDRAMLALIRFKAAPSARMTPVCAEAFRRRAAARTRRPVPLVQMPDAA